jgi:hypothetical protein
MRRHCGWHETLAASAALATPELATEPSILESDIGSNEEETKCAEWPFLQSC